jgi:hypothetical protein
VRNEEALQRVKEEWNAPQTIKRRKVKLIGHTLHRNRLIKYVIEGNIEGLIEVAGRRGRIRKQLLDDLKEKRGYRKRRKH